METGTVAGCTIHPNCGLKKELHRIKKSKLERKEKQNVVSL